VRRSWSRDFPKGDHEEAIPIHPELKPHLEQALRRAKGQLLFPAPNGKMLPRDFKLAEKLRSAMARAGIVLGYKHICRRCKASGIDSHEDAQDGTIRRCAKCNAKMWPSPVPKPCTFHELRHTTATLLLAGGADMYAVARILRHTDPKVTFETYAHLVPGYLHEQVDRLSAVVPEVGSISFPSFSRRGFFHDPSPPDQASGDATPVPRPVRKAAPAQSGPFETSPASATMDWRAWQESNLRPAASKAAALSS